ncbi:hypothetical protein LRS12_03780 [Sphingomonas sp. J344]|uniref:endonuclease/exonuclease/phosphatase family protein n=1 Tax=Sphingomonas sp. J344 TaxID=2898434 RepID=UPI00215132E5|nr:endonuclease/exonuclease/phosphatase family protein [Sphingomonas sp. J344]MCR5869941.1 hypothetical protein [Sphingomonas sp. J344]
MELSHGSPDYAGGVAATAIVALPARAARPATGLRVMAFNVRLPRAEDGVNRWEARGDLFVETIRRTDPDIIGTQELWKIQGDYVLETLPGYSWFGIDRRGGHGDEHMGGVLSPRPDEGDRTGQFLVVGYAERAGEHQLGASLSADGDMGVVRDQGRQALLADQHAFSVSGRG